MNRNRITFVALVLIGTAFIVDQQYRLKEIVKAMAYLDALDDSARERAKRLDTLHEKMIVAMNAVGDILEKDLQLVTDEKFEEIIRSMRDD